MIEDTAEKGKLIKVSEIDLENGEAPTTYVHGIAEQQYLHGDGEVVAYVGNPEKQERKKFHFNVEEISFRLGNLDTTTCDKKQREMLNEVIALGNLEQLTDYDLQRLIALDAALGNLI